MTQRVRLIHWNAAEAKERADRLASAGFEVDYEQLDPTALRQMREDPPAAIVIDLSRLPSQGRDTALGIRKYKATRHVPLVFVEGDPKKVARIEELLPDAVYATWADIGKSLQHAIDHPLTDPVVPDSTMAGYSGTPLPKKLGIKANSVVALVDAPDGFEETLGALPKGAVLTRGAPDEAGVTLWFTRSKEGLEQGIGQMRSFAEKGGLWIIWPKKASGVASDLSQTVVRETGLATGLVDYKVAAIDATWSGLRFTQRK
jgi:DNA-binding response OmpR family regulator